MKTLFTCVVAAVVTSLCLGSVASVVNWSADFESPPYVLDSLDTQQGWLTDSTVPSVIADGTAPSGSQVLYVAGPTETGDAVGYPSANTDLVKLTFYMNGPTGAGGHAGLHCREGSTYFITSEFQESGDAGWGYYNIEGSTGAQYAGVDGAKVVWNAGTWEKLEYWMDFANDQFAVKINDVTISEWYDNGGSLIDTHTWTPFINPVSGLDTLQIRIGTMDAVGTPYMVDALVVDEGCTEFPPDPPPPVEEYMTSFEALNDPSGDTFILGPLKGQGGWEANNDSASIVQNSFFDSGSQAVRVTDASNPDSHYVWKSVTPMWDVSPDSIIQVELSLKPAGFYSNNITVWLADDLGQKICSVELTDGTSKNYGYGQVEGQWRSPLNPFSWSAPVNYFWTTKLHGWQGTDWEKLTFNIDLANQTFDILWNDFPTNCIDLHFLVDATGEDTNTINNVSYLTVGHKALATDTYLDEVKFRYIPRPQREVATSFEASEGFVPGELTGQNNWYGQNYTLDVSSDKIAVQNSVKRSGEYAIEIGDITDPFSDVYRLGKDISGYDTGTMYVDFYIKPPAYASMNSMIRFMSLGAHNSKGFPDMKKVCEIQLIDAMSSDSGSIMVEYSDTQIQLPGDWWFSSKWLRITVAFDLDNKKFDVLLDGDTVDSLTNLDFVEYVPSFNFHEDVRKVEFLMRPGYIIENEFATLMYLDDFTVSDTFDTSTPEVTITDIVYDSAGLTVEWESTAGKTYSVYWKDNMTDTWTKAADVVATGDPTDWADTGGAGRTDPRDVSVNKRFYMIKEL
jgi:hypothetical protein